MKLLRFFSLLALLGISFSLSAQSFSRSGLSAPAESKSQLRSFPCGGMEIWEENFEADTLPAGWSTIDGDQLAPKNEILFLFPQGGWQPILDFKDSSNHALASPSWYQGSDGPSDDWLISPQIQALPSNVCLSWYAYSQDLAFPEQYEIRVSTTTPDTAGFLANPPVVVIEEEESDLIFRSTSLAAYAGQDIYIAFRQTSADRFALVLDDIRLAQVETFDLALFEVAEINADTGVDVRIRGAVINLGLDTVVFDSSALSIHYQIDAEPVQSISLVDPFTLLPNDTIQFNHDSIWTPTENKVYRFRLWISGFGTDDNAKNDSVSRWQGIGTKTPIEEKLSPIPLTLSPNPTSDRLVLTLKDPRWERYSLSLLDLQGREVLPLLRFPQSRQVISVSHLNEGLYFLKLQDETGRVWTEKILVRF